MDAVDLPAVHAHLDHALRHLEAASALSAGIAEADHLTAHERFALNDDAAEAGLLVEQLTRAIAGPSFDLELARLLNAVD